MLYYWFVLLSDTPFKGFANLFRYLTFRTMGAILTAFFIGIFLGRPLINWLKQVQKNGQPIRDDGPESHLLTKQGTPTMGGVLILISLGLSSLLWADLRNPYLWITLFVTLGFGLVGSVDDYLKLTKRSAYAGLTGKTRLTVEVIIVLIALYLLETLCPQSMVGHVTIPFLKKIVLDLGWFFYPFALFVVVGASNAVNLTDGLDGLAIVPSMLVAGCFALIAYITGNQGFSHYLQIFYIPNVGELTIFCGALVGAGLSFLWYNAPPAKVFMGDTGSLAIGAALGMVSVMTKNELVLAIMGGIFVLETISVIIQVGYFKLYKKRIFLMAPIHHHFEKKGWAESTIVIRFWIISALLALVGLATLKLR